MPPGVPAEDPERVPLSGDHTALYFGVAYPSIIAAGSVLTGIGVLGAGRHDAPLGVALIILPLVGTLAWWRWGTPMRRVVATRTGLLVSTYRREWFIPYAAVASTRQSWLRGGSLIITVTLREPVAGIRRFAFVPPYLPCVRMGNEHPIATELARRLEGALARP